jgi:hypothetical protein
LIDDFWLPLCVVCPSLEVINQRRTDNTKR